MFYIPAFQLVSLSLSIFLRFYIYIRICVVHTGSKEVFTPHLLLARSTSGTTERITNLSFAYLLPLNLLPSLSLFSLDSDRRIVDFPKRVFRRSEPGTKELPKFLFSIINHSFGFKRAFDHGAPFRHFALPPIDLFRTLTTDETVGKDCITLKLWCY